MGRSVARFGVFEFDFDEMVLRRAGQPVSLQPQPTQVLATLLEHPGRLVSRDELKSRIWADRVVEFDAGLNFSVNQVRKALGDSAACPEYLETVPRRGYRIIAAVVHSKPEGHSSAGNFLGRRTWLWAATIVLGAAILVVEWIPLPTQGDRLSALSAPLRPAFREAEWLYKQGDAQRALSRLDSIRLAAPGFAPAWVLTSHVRRLNQDFSGARAAAERAILLDPDQAGAHFALAISAFFEARGSDALQALAEATRLDPQRAEYHRWYGEALANHLRLGEAIEQLEEARRIDPISNLVGVDLAMIYVAADRLEEAVTYCRNSLDLVASAERWARDCLLTARHFKGEDELAAKQGRALMELEGASPAEVAAVRTLRDYFQWDLERVDRLQAAGQSDNPFSLVKAHARLKDREETLRGIQALRESRHFSLQWLPRDVWFRFLHGDPEFVAILREAGLPVPEARPEPLSFHSPDRNSGRLRRVSTSTRHKVAVSFSEQM